MPDQRPLAIVKDLRAATHYAAVLDVIRSRIIELELAYPTVDVLAGFTDTYTSKLLCNPPLKRMSVDSLFSILGALALVPKFESDQDRLQRLRQHRDWQKRKKRRPIPKQSAADQAVA
jgi:predicted membrane protein